MTPLNFTLWSIVMTAILAAFQSLVLPLPFRFPCEKAASSPMRRPFHAFSSSVQVARSFCNSITSNFKFKVDISGFGTKKCTGKFEIMTRKRDFRLHWLYWCLHGNNTKMKEKNLCVLMSPLSSWVIFTALEYCRCLA